MVTEKQLLIVDDNVDAADMTAELLRLAGFTVAVAYTGQDALQMSKLVKPKVIFLDLGMPAMDGYEVAAALRSDPTLREIKIVALTAWGDEASREKSRAAGFDSHIVKPARLEALVSLAT